MSPKEAAEATGVAKLTILKWIKSGRLPAERIETKNGPGYEIRPEDLTQAIQQPRKKRDPVSAPAPGSVVAELQAMREAMEKMTREVSEVRIENRNLQAQLFQTEQRLSEVIRSLPARSEEPKPTEKPVKQGLFSRWFSNQRD